MEREFKVIEVEKYYEQWKIKVRREFEIDRGPFSSGKRKSSETYTTKADIKLKVGDVLMLNPEQWVIKKIPFSFVENGKTVNIEIKELLHKK